MKEFLIELQALLKKHNAVIVETEKGLEFGKVELENFEINEEKEY